MYECTEIYFLNLHLHERALNTLSRYVIANLVLNAGSIYNCFITRGNGSHKLFYRQVITVIIACFASLMRCALCVITKFIVKLANLLSAKWLVHPPRSFFLPQNFF
jgi:hypothetical protein